MIHQEFPFVDLDNITVESKADANYPVVSEASICAKGTRDICLENWVFDENINEHDFGCGYPSDEQSTQWRENRK